MQKKLALLALLLSFFAACGGENSSELTETWQRALEDVARGDGAEASSGAVFIDFPRAVDVGARFFAPPRVPADFSVELGQAQLAGIGGSGFVFSYAALFEERRFLSEFGFVPEDIVTVVASLDGDTTLLIVEGEGWASRLNSTGWTTSATTENFTHPDQRLQVRADGATALISPEIANEPPEMLIDQEIANAALDFFVEQEVYASFLASNTPSDGVEATVGELPVPLMVGAGVRDRGDELETVVQLGYDSESNAIQAAEKIRSIVAQLPEKHALVNAETEVAGQFVILRISSGTLAECQADLDVCRSSLWLALLRSNTMRELFIP